MQRKPTKLSAAGCAMTLLLILSGCGGGGYGGGDGGGGGGGGGAPPTISLQPPSGATVNRTVNLGATVTAPAGVTRVEFLVDGTVIGSATAAPFRVEWDTSATADGVHSLAARVTDAANAVVTSSAVSVTVRNHLTLSVNLTPDEIFPRPDSEASGAGELTFDLISGAVTGGVTISGFTPTAAHIHGAYAGADGSVVVPFVSSAANPLRWEAQAGGLLTAEQIDDLLAGKLYVNIHSAAYVDGEIRAQIAPENIDIVFTAMTGQAVVPPVTTTATALAATTVDSLALTAVANANIAGVQDATSMHVHQGAAGVNVAEEIFPLTADDAAPNRWSSGVQSITSAELGEFTNNGWYIDVHTTASPAGLLRGQIIAAPTPVPTLAQLQTAIFTPRCAECHVAQAVGLPNLTSADASFASLVNVASSQQQNLLRVNPGNPDESYLIHKLEGRPGITGVQMPADGASEGYLDQATIEMVRAWIAAGAPR